MVIITIKFKRDSDKTYDYLMKNPDKNVLDQNQCIYFAAGCNKYGPTYSTAFIVGTKKVEELPDHVTAWLVIYKNNHVSSRPISSAEKISLLNKKIKNFKGSGSSHTTEDSSRCRKDDATYVQLATLRHQNIFLRARIRSEYSNNIKNELQLELNKNIELINNLKGGH